MPWSCLFHVSARAQVENILCWPFVTTRLTDTDTDTASAWQEMATAVSTELSEELANAPLLLAAMIDEVEIGPAPDGIGTLVRASWPVKLGPNVEP